MNNWDSRYTERVKLLIDILPTLAAEQRFALKGGTAMDYEDTPRGKVVTADSPSDLAAQIVSTQPFPTQT